jgi:hypothetical protein
MALRFYGKGGSDTENCPSVSVDETDLSLVFVGWPIEDLEVIAEIEQYSHIAPDERAFRIPPDLRKAIWEPLDGDNLNFG